MGDWVLSRDENDPQGPVLAQRVEEKFVRTGQVWHLDVGGRRIRTTQEHPFYAEGKGWKPLAELAVGDRLLGENGDWLTIEAMEDTGRYETVYNLKVSEFSTYFVGCGEWAFSVWAHNADCSVAEVKAVADILGEEPLNHKNAARLAFAIRSEDPELIAQAMARVNLRMSQEELLGTLHEVQGLGLQGKALNRSLEAVDHELQVLLGLQQTGMTGPEIAHFLATLGDVPVFRGTTQGFGGGNSAVHARTPVSIDPARATLFAIEANTRFGGGILQFGSRRDIGGRLGHGNQSTPDLIVLERELNAHMTPQDFAGSVPGTMGWADARQILVDMGIDMPLQIRGPGGLQAELGNLPSMTPEQIREFLRRANGGS